MGLFSAKYKTSVATTVTRGIPDNMIPDSVQVGTLRGIFQGEQLVENILEEITSSIGVKAERMYSYAKNSYVHGLPSSSIHFSNAGEAVAQEVLTALEGQPVSISYYKYGPLNSLHYGWMALIANYGYNPQTNELTVLSAVKKTPVYLSDMVVMVAEATLAELENGSLDQWGTSPRSGFIPRIGVFSGGYIAPTGLVSTPYAIDLSATTDYLRVSYVWNNQYIHEESIKIPITGLDVNQNYFQVKYSVGGVTKYWRYQDGSGTYPTLDALFDTSQDSLGKFFPFVYFRHKKKSVAKDVNSTEYKSSTKLMKYLGMDYGELASSINENPDIDDVEQAIFTMAVPADSTNEIELEYLYDFFSKAYAESGGMARSSSVQIAQLLTPMFNVGRGAETSIVIEDARSKMTLGMTGLYKRKRVGVVAAVGKHTGERAEHVVTNTSISYQDEFDTVGTPYTWESKVPCHYYRKQISDHIYEEIQVYELNMSYRVWEDYETTSDGNSKILLVPLDHSITKNYPAADRETLYARSFHYVFNSRVVTKISWYQQAWFRFVLIVVAVVITILGDYTGSALNAALMLEEYGLAALILLEGIATMVVVNVVMKLFVKLVGAEFAMVLAVVVAVYAGFQAFDAGSVAGAPWASDLLQLASGLMKESGNFYTEALQGLQEEVSIFTKEMREKEQLLETANKLLQNTSLLSPFVIFGESPNDLYNRTVHSGNVGIVAIDAIHEYVGIALMLPKLDTTVGDTFSV